MTEIYRDSCRACMSKDVPLQGIFQTEVNSVPISAMLTFISSLHIGQNDGLPDMICSTCFNSLLISYEFQQMCVNSDMQMRANLALLQAQSSLSGDGDVEEAPKPSSSNVIEAAEQQHRSYDRDEENQREEDLGNVRAFESTGELVLKSELFDDEEHDGDGSVSGMQVDQAIKDELSSEDESISKPDDAAEETKLSAAKRSKALPKPKLECEICKKVFDKNYRLLRHRNVHNAEGRPHECEICKIRFVHESSMRRHLIVHSDTLNEVSTVLNQKTNFQCPECPKEFSKQESLSSHMRTHRITMSGKKYLCDLCPKVFSRLNLLTRHSKSHDELRNYQCNLCDKKFALNSQLIDHLNRHKGVKPHICPICNKGFQQSCTLKDHLRTHSGETPFLCAECGKAFNNSSNLRQHVLRHTGAKPFHCPECPSRFTCKGGLKSHMATHMQLKPYSCDQCDSKFTKPYSLNKHKRIHTGEKPYSCEVCGMKFNSSDHVKRHMRTHTGEKPYRCKFCDRAFAQSNDLVKHTRSHVGEKTYVCSECSAAFRLHSELRVHVQEHYRQKKDAGGGMSGSDTNSNSHDDSLLIESPEAFRELLDFSVQ